MNRTGLVLVAFGIAVIGYAVMYDGLTHLNPCLSPTGQPVGTIDALIPGRVTSGVSTPAAAGFSSTGGPTSSGGGSGAGGTHTGAR